MRAMTLISLTPNKTHLWRLKILHRLKPYNAKFSSLRDLLFLIHNKKITTFSGNHFLNLKRKIFTQTLFKWWQQIQKGSQSLVLLPSWEFCNLKMPPCSNRCPNLKDNLWNWCSKKMSTMSFKVRDRHKWRSMQLMMAFWTQISTMLLMMMTKTLSSLKEMFKDLLPSFITTLKLVSKSLVHKGM